MRKGTFEDRIFYDNHVSLNEDRWDCLKSIVTKCQPPIPYYVSTVTRSAVIRGKSKMVNTWTSLFANHTSLVKMPSCRDREEDGCGCANHTYFFVCKSYLIFYVTLFISLCNQCFSKDYSQAYLKDYLRKPMVVRVTNEHFEGNKKVLFKMGKKDGRAIMTKNWREVIEGARMKEGQMAIFRFMERSGGGLRVNMVSGMRIR